MSGDEKKDVSEEKEVLAEWKFQRKVFRSKVTRKYNEVQREISEWDVQDCREIVEELTFLKSELKGYDDKISAEVLKLKGDDALNSELDDIDSYSTKLKSCLRKLNEKISAGTLPESSISGTTSGVVRSTRLKLPEIPLPFFDYEGGENLIQFF